MTFAPARLQRTRTAGQSSSGPAWTDRPTVDPQRLALARWSARAAIVGPVLFGIAFTLAGFLRPGYSPVRQAITALGNGPNGWMEWASAILAGLLLTVFAIGFSLSVRVMDPVWRRSSGVLLSLPGIGLALAGMTDAPAYRLAHTLVSQLALWGAVLAFLVTGIGLYRGRRWPRWAVYTLLASPVTLLLLGLTFASAMSGTPVSGLGGLTERLVVVEILAWYVASGCRTLVELG